MADGVKEVRFWHGWPERDKDDPYELCIDPPKILFNGGQIALTDDSAVDPDGSPPVGEDCCCCDECRYCIDTKHPSMVTVNFSGVVNPPPGSAACTDCHIFNNTLYELKCSRSAGGSLGGGTCGYECSCDVCIYDSILYEIHALYSGSYYPHLKIARSDARDPALLKTASSPTYDINCEASQSLVFLSDDSGVLEFCDWTNATATVDPEDCDD